MDVMPVVDLGRQPAKATVGEPFPVSATVFREGHDQLGAEVVLTGPDGAAAAPGADGQARRGARPLRRLGDPRRRRAPGPSRCRPGPTRSRPGSTTPGIKIPAGVDVELMFTEGRLLLERVAAEPRRRPTGTGTSVLDGAIEAAGDTEPPGRGPARRAAGPRARRAVLLAHPLRELVTVEGPYPAYADRDARALRQLVRVLPALRGRHPRRRDRQGHQRHLPAPPPSGSTPSPRWASTSSTCRRSTRSARSTARARTTRSPPAPTTPARRGRSAPRTAATTRSTPTSAPSRTSTRSWRAPASSASRSPSTWPCRPRPDHPWVDRRTREWFTTRADGTIAYAENPPKKYQDIYPINFDNDPDGHLPRGAARRPALDVATACGSSGSTTRTPSRWRSGSGCSRRSAAPTPTCSSCPRRSPGRR